jgi:hypothetical protein
MASACFLWTTGDGRECLLSFSSATSSGREENGFKSLGDDHFLFNGHGIWDSDFSLDLGLEPSNRSVILFVSRKSRSHEGDCSEKRGFGGD